jgi:hypothetical protein
MIYSLPGKCMIHNEEPFYWFKEIPALIPDRSVQKPDELLP